MDIYLRELTNKLYELYRAYEDHAFHSYMNGKNNRRLVVNFKPDNTIHFALFEKNQSQEFELVDEVYIGFDDERELYEATALNIFIKALGNVMIHHLGDNMYYNSKHKPYVLVIAEDRKVMNIIDKLIENQEKEAINLNNEIVKEINYLVKTKKYDSQFLYQIEDRMALTKELFRRW